MSAERSFLHQPGVAERLEQDLRHHDGALQRSRPTCLDQVLDRMNDDLAPVEIAEACHERGEQCLRLARMNLV